VIVIFHKIYFLPRCAGIIHSNLYDKWLWSLSTFCDFKTSRKAHDLESNENLLLVANFFNLSDGHVWILGHIYIPSVLYGSWRHFRGVSYLKKCREDGNPGSKSALEGYGLLCFCSRQKPSCIQDRRPLSWGYCGTSAEDCPLIGQMAGHDWTEIAFPKVKRIINRSMPRTDFLWLPQRPTGSIRLWVRDALQRCVAFTPVNTELWVGEHCGSGWVRGNEEWRRTSNTSTLLPRLQPQRAREPSQDTRTSIGLNSPHRGLWLAGIVARISIWLGSVTLGSVTTAKFKFESGLVAAWTRSSPPLCFVKGKR
jgi:hypothetical protein